MKNISRRVFIKGLAVAGVAAAASTVLAGCNTNMLPDVDNGTDEPSEETPAKNEAMVYTVGGDSSKTLTITAGDVIVLGASNTIAIPFTVNNKSGKKFEAKKTATASAGKLVMGSTNVTVEFDGVDGSAADVAVAENMFASAGVSLDSGKEKTYMLYIADVPALWNKLKVTFDLIGKDATTEYTAKKGEFNFTNK